MRKLLVAIIAAVSVMAVPSLAQARRTYTVSSTAYTPCSAGSIMADGTRTRLGSVANNFLPLGTKIRLSRPGPYGLRTFYVRDRIGYGTHLDFWVPSCSYGWKWGRRTVRFRVIRYGYRYGRG